MARRRLPDRAEIGRLSSSTDKNQARSLSAIGADINNPGDHTGAKSWMASRSLLESSALCKLQHAFGNRFGVARYQRDVHGFRPAVPHIVKNRTPARQSDKSSAGTLNGSRFAARF